jgi:branched-chain amino acid transport system ATP-binding protein
MHEMTQPALELKGVSAGYGGGDVVRGIDLHVMPGEVVALLGPNGAGKSTLLAVSSGFVPPTSGTVSVLGAAPRTPHRLARRGVAHVPENRGIFSQLTTRENLLLAVHHRDAIERAVAIFPELTPLLPRRAGLLSGGEQQMLALGRALASSPKLLMLDEMSLGLAPVIVERLLPIAQDAASSGAAVLLVEQHTELALRHSDRAYVLVHGDIRATAASTDLLKDPAFLDRAFLGLDPMQSPEPEVTR